MRIAVVAALASLGLVPALATADPAAAGPVASGQELARTGDYAGAIREFALADAQAPTAATACLIGLAELRRHEPGQAEVRFAQCRGRATPSDPLPSWLAASERELAGQLAEVAPVAIAVAPATADVLIPIDGWDAPFMPRTIHLAPGRYHVVAHAPGAPAVTADVEVAGAAPRTITLQLSAAAPPPIQPPVQPVAHARAHGSRYVIAAGVVTLAVAGIVDVTAVRGAANTLRAEQTVPQYDTDFGAYSHARDATIALLAAGSLTTAIGIVMHRREAEAEPALRVGAGVAHGGAVVTLEWTR